MLLRLLRARLRPYVRLLAAVVLLQAAQTVANLYLPTLNARIIDRGIARGDQAFIRSTGVVMLGITLLQAAFAIGAVYCGSRAATAFGRDVRDALFHQVTGYSAREVARFGAPSLITRITNDVQQVQMLVQMTCTLLVAAPIMVVGGTVMALRDDLGLSVTLLVSIPVLVLILGNVISRMIPQYRTMQERIDAINKVMREQITGLRVVRAFVREPHEAARFAAVNDDLTRNSLRAGRLMACMFPSVMFVLNLSSVAVVWIGADRIAARSMSIGALVAFLTYLAQILMSVLLATLIVVMVPRAAVCAERIQEVLDTPSSVPAPSAPVAPSLGMPALELREVGFHYPGADRPVLSDVSFLSLAGRTTALIGSTGAGKTTLVNLVPRLADVTAGAVLIDGVDVRDLAPEVLWARIGLVPQKPYLFSGTVASNLRHAKPDASDEELWAALDVAQAKDFVERLPGGLEARIAQGGSNLSGGQRQRVAIARALVRRPEIYLFDDSFSALDLATDARLRAALVPWTRDATVLVVAQRIASIRHADQIVVLEDGRVVGIGTHDELCRDCPTYAEIVASQRSAEEVAA